jgi:hypothetical protein
MNANIRPLSASDKIRRRPELLLKISVEEIFTAILVNGGTIADVIRSVPVGRYTHWRGGLITFPSPLSRKISAMACIASDMDTKLSTSFSEMNRAI